MNHWNHTYTGSNCYNCWYDKYHVTHLSFSMYCWWSHCLCPSAVYNNMMIIWNVTLPTTIIIIVHGLYQSDWSHEMLLINCTVITAIIKWSAFEQLYIIKAIRQNLAMLEIYKCWQCHTIWILCCLELYALGHIATATGLVWEWTYRW